MSDPADDDQQGHAEEDVGTLESRRALDVEGDGIGRSHGGGLPYGGQLVTTRSCGRALRYETELGQASHVVVVEVVDDDLPICLPLSGSHLLRHVPGEGEAHDLVPEIGGGLEHQGTASIDHSDAVLPAVVGGGRRDAACTGAPMHPNVLDA